MLRADIGHLQDRGKHSNEREYAALTEIWEKFSDLHTATNNCVMGFVQFPDLQRMDEERIAKFLDKNDFTEDERAAVRNAADKNDGFSRVVGVRSIAQARRAYFDFRLGSTSRIFSSRNRWRTSLDEAADVFLRADRAAGA